MKKSPDVTYMWYKTILLHAGSSDLRKLTLSQSKCFFWLFTLRKRSQEVCLYIAVMELHLISAGVKKQWQRYMSACWKQVLPVRTLHRSKQVSTAIRLSIKFQEREASASDGDCRIEVFSLLYTQDELMHLEYWSDSGRLLRSLNFHIKAVTHNQIKQSE